MPYPFFERMFEGDHEKTAAIAGPYRAMAGFMKAGFFDAVSVVSTDGRDGIHLGVGKTPALGKALAAKVTKVLGPTPRNPSQLTRFYGERHTI